MAAIAIVLLTLNAATSAGFAKAAVIVTAVAMIIPAVALVAITYQENLRH